MYRDTSHCAETNGGTPQQSLLPRYYGQTLPTPSHSFLNVSWVNPSSLWERGCSQPVPGPDIRMVIQSD
jgi:hypothetical protein